MKRFLVLAAFVVMCFGMVDTASAEDVVSIGNEGTSWVFPGGAPGRALGISIGAGLIVFGAAKGISNIGANATQAIARQPEAGGRIFTTMLLSAALIEGFTFFALLIQFTL